LLFLPWYRRALTATCVENYGKSERLSIDNNGPIVGAASTYLAGMLLLPFVKK
jgi:hypothetical protein